jgi:hypothetical protein
VVIAQSISNRIATMANIHLDALASLLSFVGAGILSIDALRVRGKVKQKGGLEKLVEAIRRSGATGLLYDDNGTPLETAKDIEGWFAGREFRLALWGFLLLAAGFALDIICKTISNPLLFP